MKRWLLLLFVLDLVIVSTAVYFAYQGIQPTEVAAPIQPVTVPVISGDVLQTVTAPGQLVGTNETILSLPVGGRITELNVRPGSMVKAGEVLARLDDQPFQQALAHAQLQLEQAETEAEYQLAQLQLTEQGSQALVDQALAQFPSLTAAELQVQSAVEAEARAQNEYNKALDRPWEPADVLESYRLELVALQRQREVAEADLNQLRNQQWSVGEEVAARQSELDRIQTEATHLGENGVDPFLALAVEEAQAQLEATILHAPFDGVVLSVDTKPGETLASGQPLLLLIDPTAVEVRTTVIEEDLPLVQLGLPVELFFDAQPETAVTGQVARIVPQRVPGEERPLYYVYIAVTGDMPPTVYPGMTADASITIASRTNALRLPRALVQPGADGTAVVEVWTQGQQRQREVTIGLRGDVYAEILNGLQEGDEVVAE